MSDISHRRDRRFMVNVLLCIAVCIGVYFLTEYDGGGLSFIIPLDHMFGD